MGTLGGRLGLWAVCVGGLSSAYAQVDAPPPPPSGRTAVQGCVPSRVEGPYGCDNLAIYLVHGRETDGRRYLTLGEGLALGRVIVREQLRNSGGNCSTDDAIVICNLSDHWLFVQTGDVVQGGSQDRTIVTDASLAPRSGFQRVPVYCVEQGRSGDRGCMFTRNTGLISGLSLRRAIRLRDPQEKVWDEVERMETYAVALAGGKRSATGTYNAILAHPALRDRRNALVGRLLPRLEQKTDVLGLVVAVNGRLRAADLYVSNDLFARVSRKLLESYALEAVLARPWAREDAHAPSAEDVVACFETVESGEWRDDAVKATGEERAADGAQHRVCKTAYGSLYEFAEGPHEASSTGTAIHRHVEWEAEDPMGADRGGMIHGQQTTPVRPISAESPKAGSGSRAFTVWRDPEPAARSSKPPRGR